eukprot:jgi/Hompol1/1351/HPOL_005573-RA
MKAYGDIYSYSIDAWDIDSTSPYLLRCYEYRKPAAVCIDNDFALYHIRAGEPLALRVFWDGPSSPTTASIELEF